jgi:hypothetical protein
MLALLASGGEPPIANSFAASNVHGHATAVRMNQPQPLPAFVPHAEEAVSSG